jgi:hypothetical protein
MWKIGQDIGDREGRMDACVAAAGILRSHTDCLEYSAAEFREVRSAMRKFFLQYKRKLMGSTGDRRQRERRSFHCAGGG